MDILIRHKLLLDIAALKLYQVNQFKRVNLSKSVKLTIIATKSSLTFELLDESGGNLSSSDKLELQTFSSRSIILKKENKIQTIFPNSVTQHFN